MPVPTNSRYEPAMSPPLSTPARSSLRTNSNTTSTSYSPTVTSGGQSKLNVVTRVAIEGKAKNGKDGASIRMFLKICLPLDSVTPGSTIPLFPEENLKILTSQVHPLDNNSVPYNFSSTVSPLLHNAARALNLPARSHESFNSTFNIAKSNGHSSSIRSSKSESSEHTPPVDVQYTGHILVSGYNISYVLPKVFIPHRRAGSDEEGEGFSRTPAGRRRPSIGERNQAQFMAAIDMWIPFLSKPMRYPYLLSIPTPRCLHNHIRLGIFPPSNTATSFASLSSMEDDGWDLTSDPHVTRVATRPSRSGSTNHFADDESSDASTSGSTEGCTIRGTFPSAERIRIRWAKPQRNMNLSGEENGRKRAGVDNAEGEMICTVLGKGTSASNPEVEGILIGVEFKGHCKGLWHPSVATMLGLDCSIMAKGSDIFWARGHPSQWEVSGGTGYTGFDNGISTPRASNSRASSFDSNGPQGQQESYQTARTANATGSTSSLLRAPLPAQNLPDYSFEGSASTAALPPISVGSASIPSLTGSLMGSIPSSEPRPPGSPITLHINMNDLQPPGKNALSFNISGTVLVAPRALLGRLNSSTTSNKTTDFEPITLPRFTILAAENELCPIIVRSDVEDATVEVFHPTGDIHNDPQTRKTVLQRNGSTKCGEDGGRITLKFIDTFHINNGHTRPVSRPRTPSNNALPRTSTNSPVPRNPLPPRAKREGPPIITSVEATITAVVPGSDLFPDGYAARVCLRTPAAVDSEWLEFGISASSKNVQPSSSSSATVKTHPMIVLVCASIDGVPVKAEITRATAKGPAGGAPFEELSGTDWISWGKIFAGASVGGNMIIDYLVRYESATEGKGKKKAPNRTEMDVLLPTFFLPVSRFEVKIDVMPGLDISSVRSEFDYVHATPTGHRLLLFSMKEFTQPHLSLTIRKSSKQSDTPVKWYFILTWMLLLVTFASLYRLATETYRLQKLTEGYSGFVESWPEIPTITATATVYGSSSSRWWFADTETASLSPSSSVAHPSLTTTEIVHKITTDTPSTHLQHEGSSRADSVRETSVIPITSQSLFDNFGLIPLDNIFIFSWSEQHTAAVKKALGKVVESMEFVWSICRKVYHYPLDPP